ncbi:hypothetical protein PIB30_069037 [Stylosanthes scabra]|uniref:Uncharacterized protein n=1 Tax=Stylosanthes scabra TaxID=79078 RepID=A0ABU6UNP4_9FABA|nr:hypothetical protein [Stylosanthes scabra]
MSQFNLALTEELELTKSPIQRETRGSKSREYRKNKAIDQASSLNNELEDLLKVISETKAGSEQVVSNSETKSVHQEMIVVHEEKQKEDTPIQKARFESMNNKILRSAAQKMINIMNQPLEILQKDAYWNNELVVVTSCLAEQKFPDEYRKQISCFGQIFENLFHTRENLSNICLKESLIQENCESIDTTVTTLKEKDAVYEKHLSDANVALADLSKEKDELTKKLAEIQARIQEVDDKTQKIKKPFEKIRGKRSEIKSKLSEFEQLKQQNEEDLKNLQKEEDQELELFKNLEEDKVQLKDALEEFLKRFST